MRSVQPQILLVDDEPAVVRSCQRLLEAVGYQVTCAHGGAEAELKLLKQRYDVLITDIGMPEVDGLALLKTARKLDSEMSVVLMTGDPSVNSAIDAIHFGVCRYLVKPIRPTELRSAVAFALGQRDERIQSSDEMVVETGENRLLKLFETALDSVWIAFQPIVHWESRTTFGYEALVRTDDSSFPDPMSLFKAAEQLNMLHPLSRRIRHSAAVSIAAGPKDVTFFVNLHPFDLNDPELLSATENPLVPFAKDVVFEITERASLHTVSDLAGAVASLRSLGFRLAIDDLGAGYSGLASFTRLEPDVVKFDISIVRDVDKLGVNQRLISSISTLCHEMGVVVVAEGVDNVNERDRLIELGCNYLQGFFFARPGRGFPKVNWGE